MGWGIGFFLFEILGIFNAKFAAHINDRKRISRWSVYLNSAMVREKSRQQNCVTLSVIEAELIAACKCAQDMMCTETPLPQLSRQNAPERPPIV